MSLVGTISLFAGTFFLLAAAIGIVRLPDVYARMHAITKGGTAGIGFMMLGLILFEPSVSVTTRALGIVLFVALTAPVAAHMIGRAAYMSGVDLWTGTIRDELDHRSPEHPEPPEHVAADQT